MSTHEMSDTPRTHSRHASRASFSGSPASLAASGPTMARVPSPAAGRRASPPPPASAEGNRDAAEAGAQGRLLTPRALLTRPSAPRQLMGRRPSMPELATPTALVGGPSGLVPPSSPHSATVAMAQEFQAKLSALTRPETPPEPRSPTGRTALGGMRVHGSAAGAAFGRRPLGQVMSLDERAVAQSSSSGDSSRDDLATRQPLSPQSINADIAASDSSASLLLSRPLSEASVVDEPIRKAASAGASYEHLARSSHSAQSSPGAVLSSRSASVRTALSPPANALAPRASIDSRPTMRTLTDEPPPGGVTSPDLDDASKRQGRRRSVSFTLGNLRPPAFLQRPSAVKPAMPKALTPEGFTVPAPRSDQTTPVLQRRRNSVVIETHTISLRNRGLTNEEINQYRVMGEIGKGSYGAVYMAQSRDDGRRYAIKAISKRRLRKRTRQRRIATDAQDELREISQEVAVLKKISAHPHFVRLVEVLNSETEDTIFMVFDLCEKGPIMKLEMHGQATPFVEHDARRYFRQMMLAVEFLHHQKIIHGDIKPDNILLNADDTVQFSDFGVSKMFDGDDDWLQSMSGSPAFNAPEICSSATKKFHGKAVDVWAMGVTLYCLVCGRLPFRADSIIALYAKILHNTPEYPPTLSPSLRDLLERMLDKDSERRITVRGIRTHAWVTNHGQQPLPTEEDNCRLVDVTSDDVGAAVKPTVSGSFAKFIRDKLFFRTRTSEPNASTVSSLRMRGERA